MNTIMRQFIIIGPLAVGVGATHSLALAEDQEIALADEKAVQKYRNYTPQQIKNLPEEVVDRALPMMYLFAAQRGLSVDSELLFGMELNVLMYPGLHDYKAAVKAFQADLGDEPTGVLTVWQIHNLEQRSDMQKLSKVGFPEIFFGVKTDDGASVQGTMVFIDEKIAWPINHVKVSCVKSQNYCRLDQINLTVPANRDGSIVATLPDINTCEV
ncbi:MAG TPA: hypothetical protein EYN18_08185 [Nitrospirales bacterium]|nr:hypothetical protein [Nitrospirales bacterium]HIB53751.1 hypothetical protein [Nitrospirales bacterium]HIC05076.1 hypothetical protein [Nitrospirales bacterium]HIO22355.1 hypothetical protein [Nitrospirales bacterium]